MGCIPVKWLCATEASAAEHVDDRQQDDGSKQRYQRGGQSNRIIDRPNVEERAQEVTGQKSADDGRDHL